MIVKSEAVVLKSMRYRETSKIVTVYCRKFGKLRGIAKGARGAKSKFGAALEPMSYVAMVLYKKEHRDLQMISECEIVTLFPRLHSDLSKITAGLSVVELLNAATQDGEPSEAVFKLLVDVLAAVDHATINLENVLYYFRLHFLDLMGFKPNFQTCIRCKKKVVLEISEEEFVSFDPQGGGVVCGNCSRIFPKRLRLSFGTVKIFQELLRAPLAEVTTIEVPAVSKREIEETLKTYSRYHLAGAERLRAEAVSKKMAV